MNDPSLNSASPDKDNALLQRIRQRDENALSVLFDRYSTLVYSTLMRMLRSVEDAEDILQDLFTHIWNNPEFYETPSDLSLTTIMTETRKRSLTRIHTRGNRKQVLHHESAVLPLYSDSASINVIPDLPGHCAPSRILSALKKLDEDEQRILSLAYYDGLSLVKISHRLKLAVGTVSWALRKSLNTLRALILNDNPAPAAHEKQYLELCAACALDMLDVRDAEEFDKHLSSGCEICRSEISGHQETVSFLPLGLPHLTFSTELKQRVLFAARLSEVVRAPSDNKQITESHQNAHVQKIKDTKTGKFGTGYAFSVLLTVVLMASIVYIIILHKKLDQRSQQNDQQSFIERLSVAVELKNDIMQILTSADLTIIPFTPYQIQFKSHGKLFWNTSDTAAVIHVSQLPTIPDHQAYQLWAFVKGKYYSCGTFAVKRQLPTENYFILKMPKSIQASGPINFFITLEKKGGTDTPQGTRYLTATFTAEN